MIAPTGHFLTTFLFMHSNCEVFCTVNCRNSLHTTCLDQLDQACAAQCIVINMIVRDAAVPFQEDDT